ncbi:hypothetical protein CAPTEDRAFT_187219 [Capitella teleta]|uniref:Uncharacterized protein n=1 Tax=Capitella teleta TaxID=283909 RepID=R7V9R7_CAPTE|nr:hypothetical protein CAPTEDRAFT_187219 [Capitella teleta]|eukprot:ELU15232.1 hypothetical protein CAPTEDRAFT_187219 [Capitella teleta]
MSDSDPSPLHIRAALTTLIAWQMSLYTTLGVTGVLHATLTFYICKSHVIQPYQDYTAHPPSTLQYHRHIGRLIQVWETSGYDQEARSCNPVQSHPRPFPSIYRTADYYYRQIPRAPNKWANSWTMTSKTRDSIHVLLEVCIYSH